MELIVTGSGSLQGSIAVPASKSHTIRAVLLAALAPGVSRLHSPLLSEDTRAVIEACQALGARITPDSAGSLIVEGFGTTPRTPEKQLNMLNSGTTTNLLLGVLAALGVEADLTGDNSLCSRPVRALAEVLQSGGCTITYHGRTGYPPLRVSGTFSGGTCTIDASRSSQYVSSLLIAAAMCTHDTVLRVSSPTELPYIDMTLRWLQKRGIVCDRSGYTFFRIPGGQRVQPFEARIPADWSSAAFPLCAAAVTPSDVLVTGLDLDDVQGDKAIIEYLHRMGAALTVETGAVRVHGARLQGATLDINATPDALPVLSVLGCCAKGTTRLGNVAQARFKETDRISVMATELRRFGAAVEELPDGLHLRGGRLTGTSVHGHHDHRVVMALSIAGLAATGTTTIDTAEAIDVTYPGYIETMQGLGAQFRTR